MSDDSNTFLLIEDPLTFSVWVSFLPEQSLIVRELYANSSGKEKLDVFRDVARAAREKTWLLLAEGLGLGAAQDFARDLSSHNLRPAVTIADRVFRGAVLCEVHNLMGQFKICPICDGFQYRP